MLDFLNGTSYDLDAKKDILDAFTASIGKSSIWAALAIAVILIAVGVIVNLKFRDKFRTFIAVAISVIVGFAIALSFVLLYITFTRMSLNGDLNKNFYLVVGFAATVIVAVVTCALLKIFYSKGVKYAIWASLAVVLAYAIALLCVLPTDEYTKPNNYPLYIALSAILVVAIALGAILGDLKKPSTDSTKALTYAGICIAISYGLSYVKFVDFPYGGSITLVSMLPLMLYSYMFGTKKGVITALVYGVLQSMQDPQIYEPLQVLLDYPVAFASIGLAGMFKGRKFLKGNHLLELVLGIALAGVTRYFAHVLSGYFVFYSWAEYSPIAAFQDNAILYSFGYNVYVIIDMIFDAVVGAILFSSKSLMRIVNGVSVRAIEAPETEQDAPVDEQPSSENKTE